DGWSADYTADISGWTTDAYRYIKIYTPVSSSEVGVSQRHNGKWDNTKYRIVDDTVGINITGSITRDIWIDGLQIYLNSVVSHGNSGILINQSGVVDHRISNNIVQGVTNMMYVHVGIYNYAASAGSAVRIWNNIVYNFSGSDLAGSDGFGINTLSNFTAYIYNNTVYGCYNGYANTGTTIAKNNIA
ncbi:MAG: hypothetical protein GWO08_02600, partial [Gammaproteobacteria bacterium]|nr:hypothetical protein [Gammaproteobacteria bacterium]NIW46429.1 hypothetical protein [Gammaproteobacteria bacterium]